jgi:PASTA domain
MAARFAALLPRLIALSVIWLLGAATYSLAAGNGTVAQQDAQAPPTTTPNVLAVPDVRGQTYVFAKGILQDAGFAWRAEGLGRGYSTDLVQVQNPAPLTEVVDNGTPTVVLRLAGNPDYSPRGLPERSSPYPGTSLVLFSEWKKLHAAKPKPKPKPKTQTGTTGAGTSSGTAAIPRTPDFAVAGAPKEPSDEMPLPDRARLVEERLAHAPRPSKKLVGFWLYQHTWIVTGARFGWSRGDEALRVLIRVDETLERRWGFGVRSAAVARRALAYVEAQKR